MNRHQQTKGTRRLQPPGANLNPSPSKKGINLMGKLSDILNEGDDNRLRQAWGETEAAEDFAPLPGGDYVARIIAGELCNSHSKSTPGYKLTFKVIEGEYTGRQFWYDIWLTPAALPMAKRDLGKLGVTSLEQLDNPLPSGMRCAVKLVLRKDDDGSEYNKVRRFDVIRIDEPEPDAFAPAESETSDAVADGDESGGDEQPEGKGVPQ
jgi:hypothetical protein